MLDPISNTHAEPHKPQGYDAPLLGRGFRMPMVHADALTEREMDVLRLVVGGASNREIAQRAGVSENTVKFHLKNVYSKLDVCSRTAAVKAAADLGLFRN